MSNIEKVRNQVKAKTPESIIELIAKQLDRASDASARIEAEGTVVRDPKGCVVAHPAISIEITATKLATDLLAKHKL